ncbi:hypothetical protein [Limnohabitans sp. Jir61]|uniref:hypothetical protein n=1 Tax=Limnohabitans sp. Jir61 TaxID=1826168 RepID=UPI001304E9AB|nr:hypothetical protein [Limnohabitans sp. Jir61]
METFLSQFWPGLAANIAGGVALSILFFVLREHIFTMPNLVGVWECKHVVATTDYRPYTGMIVWYRIVLWQDNERIFGTGEKDREDSSTGVRTYTGKGRIFIEITGKIEKRITSSDRIHLHWKEDGERRQSTTLDQLRVSGSKNNGNLFGSFSSTAANSKGVASWKRVL